MKEAYPGYKIATDEEIASYYGTSLDEVPEVERELSAEKGKDKKTRNASKKDKEEKEEIPEEEGQEEEE